MARRVGVVLSELGLGGRVQINLRAAGFVGMSGWRGNLSLDSAQWDIRTERGVHLAGNRFTSGGIAVTGKTTSPVSLPTRTLTESEPRPDLV